MYLYILTCNYGVGLINGGKIVLTVGRGGGRGGGTVVWEGTKAFLGNDKGRGRGEKGDYRM